MSLFAYYAAFSSLLSLPCLHAQTDLTVVPEASGTEVVLATISRIQQAEIFSDDHRFLRRLAHVESRDGQEKETFRKNYHGGIWQVDKEVFLPTQDTEQYPFLVEVDGIYERISSELGIDWAKVEWEDLRVPMISALAARMYFELFKVEIPAVTDLEVMGQYWKASAYSLIPDETVEYFMEKVTELETEECKIGRMDLAFLMDTSASIGEENFGLQLQLVSNAISKLGIGADATRVAILTYSNEVIQHFDFSTFSSCGDVNEALDRLEGVVDVDLMDNTNTAEALTYLQEEVFAKRRDMAVNVSITRVAVIITDGQSNTDDASTVLAAQALQGDGVLVYSVGIGDVVNEEELESIAGSPENVIHLEDFDAEKFRTKIAADACSATIPVPLEKMAVANLAPGEVSFFNYQVPEDLSSLKLTLRMFSGEASLYASSKLQTPNSALYDYAISGEGEVNVSPRNLLPQGPFVGAPEQGKRSFRTLYVSVKGAGYTTSSMQVEASPGAITTTHTTTPVTPPGVQQEPEPESDLPLFRPSGSKGLDTTLGLTLVFFVISFMTIGCPQ